jgi:glucuronoarabinoxylan endo-1,4-beta-xylanase
MVGVASRWRTLSVGFAALSIAAATLITPLASASRSLVRSASATGIVNLSASRQVIQGFGTSERSWSDPHVAKTPTIEVPEAVRTQILTALYRRLGLTMARNTLDPGLQGHPGAPFDFVKTDAQIALVKQARRYGLTTFFPSPVQLEDWMQPSDPGAYVAYAMTVLERWRALGVTPALYSPVNEPKVSRDFPPQWLHDVVVQLGARMRAAGFKTKLVIPDDVDPIAAYTRAQAILGDPQARQYVGAVAFHIYGVGGPADWVRLRQLASRYGLPLWMTEYESPSYTTYGNAFDWAVKMHQLLTVGSVNAIDYLWGFFGDWVQSDTLISIRFNNGVFQSWSPTPLYYFVGQYSKYVRPGYRRVDASTDDQSVLVSAYKGPNRVVVIATNTASDARPVSLKVMGGGKPVRKAAVVQTTSSAGLRALPSIQLRSRNLVATLPPQSVTTFVVTG